MENFTKFNFKTFHKKSRNYSIGELLEINKKFGSCSENPLQVTHMHALRGGRDMAWTRRHERLLRRLARNLLTQNLLKQYDMANSENDSKFGFKILESSL